MIEGNRTTQGGSNLLKKELPQIILLHVLVAMFLGFLYVTKNQYMFLIVNVTLALIPFDISLAIKHIKNNWIAGLLGLVWLAFYPNTMYMITDFIYLSAIGTNIQTAYQYAHYSILALGIFSGVLFGLGSATLVFERFVRNPDFSIQVLFYGVLSFMSAVGIYLGRYKRLNTTDLVTNFHGTLVAIKQSVTPDMLAFVFCMVLVQLFLFAVFQIMKER